MKQERSEEGDENDKQLFDVVGPVCESADFVGKSMRKKLKSILKSKSKQAESCELALFQLCVYSFARPYR